MDDTQCSRQLELFEVNRQQVTVTFDGEQIVSDAGLLPIRQLDQELGILAKAARRLPDPRSQLFVQHSAERIITQQVYQILAGYPDGNDAQLLRDDPLSGVTINVAHRSGSVGLRCVLSRSGAGNEDLSKVGPGSWIKVRGTCEGKLPSGAVRLTDCIFILVNR